MSFSAIVLSAGVGSRMNSDIPKQYLSLCGYPVIYYSLKAFQDSDAKEIVLVTGKDDVEYCRKEIVEKYALTKVKKIVPGGKERYDSVNEGLNALDDTEYVMIHDGARPLLTQEIISDSLECVKKENACVVGMPVKDTIKISDDNEYAINTPDRKYLWMIQTPQTFSLPLIKSSYEKIYKDIKEGRDVPSITDDAMVLEYATGRNIKITKGDYRNIKITTPEDLEIAGLFIKMTKENNA